MSHTFTQGTDVAGRMNEITEGEKLIRGKNILLENSLSLISGLSVENPG